MAPTQNQHLALYSKIIGVLLVLITVAASAAAVGFKQWAETVEKSTVEVKDFLIDARSTINARIGRIETQVNAHDRQATIHIADYEARLRVLEQEARHLNELISEHFHRDHAGRVDPAVRSRLVVGSDEDENETHAKVDGR